MAEQEAILRGDEATLVRIEIEALPSHYPVAEVPTASIID